MSSFKTLAAVRRTVILAPSLPAPDRTHFARRIRGAIDRRWQDGRARRPESQDGAPPSAGIRPDPGQREKSPQPFRLAGDEAQRGDCDRRSGLTLLLHCCLAGSRARSTGHCLLLMPARIFHGAGAHCGRIHYSSASRLVVRLHSGGFCHALQVSPRSFHPWHSLARRRRERPGRRLSTASAGRRGAERLPLSHRRNHA